MGIEPTNPLLARQVLSQTELLAHILQNISRANYLHSAETLLSWSAEPLHFPTKRDINRNAMLLVTYLGFTSSPQ